MADDWANAEALAIEYVKTELHASQPIGFRRIEQFPFLIHTWWDNKGTSVLVYDNKVQTARGAAALPPYLQFLGESRVRGLSIDDVETLLEVLGTARPSSSLGLWSRHAASYPDLHPAIVDTNGRRAYVAHFFDIDPPLPRGLGGSRAPGPLVLHRWSFPLWPVAPTDGWKPEGHIERPRPEVRVS